MQHLITLKDYSRAQIEKFLELAADVKSHPEKYNHAAVRKTLIMLFEKPSLRTRVSFETGMYQMGGEAIFYDLTKSPLGVGKENITDMIKVLSRYVDLVMARLFEHEKIEKMVAASSIPVINGLTDYCHPCQILSDLQTILEHKGRLEGLTLAFMGDGHNNVTHSLMFACSKLGINIRVGCPAGSEFSPVPDVTEYSTQEARAGGGEVVITHDPQEAVRGADVVYTDSWMSYHVPAQQLEERIKVLTPYQVNAALMSRAAKDAIFMNCLPAARGYEQTAGVINGPQSVVFDQAENRLHMQKAIMLILLENAR